MYHNCTASRAGWDAKGPHALGIRGSCVIAQVHSVRAGFLCHCFATEQLKQCFEAKCCADLISLLDLSQELVSCEVWQCCNSGATSDMLAKPPALSLVASQES